MSVKISKNYKLTEVTLEQIGWLRKQLGDVNATDVVTIAVAELHERKREAQMARLAQKGKVYNLIVGGDVVAECSEAVVKRLPQDMRDRLLGEGVEGGGMLAALALAGAVANEQMTLYPKAIAKMRGGANR